MNKIILSGKFKVNSYYQGTTKFDFWKQIKPGDIIEIYIDIRRCYGVPEITIKVNGKEFMDYAGNILKYLSKVELEECDV